MAKLDPQTGESIPVPKKNKIIRVAGKSIIQMLLRGHQIVFLEFYSSTIAMMQWRHRAST